MLFISNRISLFLQEHFSNLSPDEGGRFSAANRKLQIISRRKSKLSFPGFCFDYIEQTRWSQEFSGLLKALRWTVSDGKTEEKPTVAGQKVPEPMGRKVGGGGLQGHLRPVRQ
jgi:hypothetical protein